jgi:hypothetical protein
MGIENILVIHGDVSPTNPRTSSLGCSVENFEKKKGKLRTYLLQLSFGLVGGFKDFKKLIARAGLGAQFQDLLFGPTGQVQP